MEHCPGCTAVLAPITGPLHKYLTASAACWACFNESLALHYEDIAYWRAHQILTDAYCLQHSAGDDPRARRSAVLHFVALYAQCNLDLPEDRVVELRRAVAARRLDTAFESWPRPTTSILAVDITHGPVAHLETANVYGRAVCEDWRHHHAMARRLCDTLLER